MTFEGVTENVKCESLTSSSTSEDENNLLKSDHQLTTLLPATIIKHSLIKRVSLEADEDCTNLASDVILDNNSTSPLTSLTQLKLETALKNKMSLSARQNAHHAQLIAQQQLHHNQLDAFYYQQGDYRYTQHIQHQQHLAATAAAVASVQHQQIAAAAAAAAAATTQHQNYQTQLINDGEILQNMSGDESGRNNRYKHSSAAAAAQQLSYENCPICSDRVSGYHYGLLTCESCKVNFF